MNILLSGVSTGLNRGVDALVRTNVGLIRKYFPQSMIWILSFDDQEEKIWNDLDVSVIKQNPSPFHIRVLKKLGVTADFFERRLFAARLKSQLPDKLDIHVVTGGDIFSSDYGDPCVWENLVRTVHRIYRPLTYLSAHSIGRFRNELHSRSFQRILGVHPVMSVRERASGKYVQDVFGPEVENSRTELLFCPDPAFILKPDDTEFTRKICGKAEQLKRNGSAGKLVVYAVSNGIAHFKGLSPFGIYQARVNFIRQLLQHGYAVLLIAHVQGRSTETNDASLCNKIKDDLANGYNRLDVCLSGNAAELKQIIRTADILIAERMHAAIAGLSQLVRTVVLGYSIKAEGILRDLFPGGKEFERVYVPIGEDAFKDLSEKLVSAAYAGAVPTVPLSDLNSYMSRVETGYKRLKEKASDET